MKIFKKQHEINQSSLLNWLRKLATEKATPHSSYSYVATIDGDYYEVFNAVELQIFKSIKVNCSNIVRSSSM